MSTRMIITLVLFFVMVLVLCVALWPAIERIGVSFPEILLGQVVLTRESKSLSPRAYQSAELVLNLVSPAEIERVTYLQIRKDALFWEPDYVGLARTELNEDEIRLVLDSLSAGPLFYPLPDGDLVQCVIQNAAQEPRLEACSKGKSFLDQFTSLKWEAEQNQAVGVLQFSLGSGRLAEIRVYPSRHGLAYTPYEIGGDWWLHGVSEPSQVLESLAARATIPSIQVLWPERTADQANRNAARIIGDRYQTALEILRISPAVREVFGEIEEIRPANGNNQLSAWMDATSMFLTLRVIGSRGRGAVILRGYDCFNLQMVFNGQPIDIGYSPICR